jgi:hypothetical protein
MKVVAISVSSVEKKHKSNDEKNKKMSILSESLKEEMEEEKTD